MKISLPKEKLLILLLAFFTIFFTGCPGTDSISTSKQAIRQADNRKWHPPEIISNNTGHSNYPQIATDSSGNAVAVWVQFDGTQQNIMANRYTAGSGWGITEIIETDNRGHASYPQIAVDPSGNAIAVWQQHDGTRNNITANRYTAGSGWGTPALLETDNRGHAYYPQVALDHSGNAVAVWEQSDGTRNNIMAVRYTDISRWSSVALLEHENRGSAYKAQIAVDPAGNAVAVWCQNDGTRYNIMANRYTAGSGWGTATLLENDSRGDAATPQIAVDSSGNAIAIWKQHDGTRYNIMANRYTTGSGWDTPTPLEYDNRGHASYPQIAVDPSGNAVAIWQQHDGARDNIMANRYTAGSGWESAVPVEYDNRGSASKPQIAVDSSGSAIAVWEQLNGSRNSVMANRYTSDKGWENAILLENDDDGDASSPQITIDSSGNALAVWRQTDRTVIRIWAARFE